MTLPRSYEIQDWLFEIADELEEFGEVDIEIEAETYVKFQPVLNIDVGTLDVDEMRDIKEEIRDIVREMETDDNVVYTRIENEWGDSNE